MSSWLQELLRFGDGLYKVLIVDGGLDEQEGYFDLNWSGPFLVSGFYSFAIMCSVEMLEVVFHCDGFNWAMVLWPSPFVDFAVFLRQKSSRTLTEIHLLEEGQLALCHHHGLTRSSQSSLLAIQVSRSRCKSYGTPWGFSHLPQDSDVLKKKGVPYSTPFRNEIAVCLNRDCDFFCKLIVQP